ncbi:neurotrophin 1-like isoform X1 [Macrobrachium nipponense]|uniref:neurotrophin 1-like isoform X1 n=1 Tax=Macrobrachium nipponense TaxID=159736 RepID=UPI0030C7AB25
MLNMIRPLIVLFLLTATPPTKAEGNPEPAPRPSGNPVPQPARVVLGERLVEDDDTEVKRDREPLLRSSKIFSFGDPIFGAIGLTGQGPLGVSLGLSPVLPVRPHAGRPVLVATHRPECALDEDYCAYNQLYPLDKVNSIIDRFYNDVRLLYNDLYQFPPGDLIYYENRTSSDKRGGHFVCESSVQYLRPGWAQNLHGEWVAVINTDKFPQSIRVENCRYKDKRCEYLPPCYKSKCVQRYNYVKLLCLDPYRPTYRPTVDVFKVPSACSCFVEDFTYY